MKRSIVLFILLFLLSAGYASDKTISVTYISHIDNEQAFGQMLYSFAQSSAKDLNIDLNIAYPDHNLNRYEYYNFAKEIFSVKPKPDFVIAVFFRTLSESLLKLSAQYDTPIFIVNTNIPTEDKLYVGQPREKYKGFLGLIAANEQQAGYQLAKYLLQASRVHNSNKPKHILAISGPHETTEAMERNKGMLKALEEDKDAELYQMFYTNWDADKAYFLTDKVVKRYKDIDIFWTASDGLALGVKKALVDNYYNEDVVVGGIDWTTSGINAVSDNYVNATVGGHFMNGGFSLVLLYDYFHGHDFKEELGTQINLNMSLLSKENVKGYSNAFSSNNWDAIDFKKYSKHINPTLNKYDFSLNSLFLNLHE